MRRFLVFSVLLQWLVFLAAICVDGIGLSQEGLLTGAHTALTDPEGVAWSDDLARSIVTVAVFSALTFILWAMLLSVIDVGVEAAERELALVIAFGWTLTLLAGALVLALLGGANSITPLLAAAQLGTLLTVLAKAGADLAAVGKKAQRPSRVADNDDAPSPAQMAVAGVRIGRLAHSARN